MSEIFIERWPLRRLLPYTANARLHSEEQVSQIAASIAEFGFTVPCLVDDQGVLIAGHGRLLAAKQLGLAEIPVIRLGHLSEAQARAYRIADNRIALNSTWSETFRRLPLIGNQQHGQPCSYHTLMLAPYLHVCKTRLNKQIGWRIGERAHMHFGRFEWADAGPF